MSPTREQIGRVLYECEKKRGEHADAVMKGISPRASDALLMEPWDECKDSFLGDADAVLSLFSSTAQPDMTGVQAVAAAILPVVDRVGTFTSEDRALEIAKLAVAALPRSAATSDTAIAGDTQSGLSIAGPALVEDKAAASTVEPVLTYSLDLGPADFVLRMHPDDQFRIATRVAGNVGYDLVPEPGHPDSPHVAPTTSPEPDAVREASPGYTQYTGFRP